MDHYYGNSAFETLPRIAQAYQGSQVVEYATYQILTSTDPTVAGYKDTYDFCKQPNLTPQDTRYKALIHTF